MPSPNEIFLDYISNTAGVSFGDSMIFWLFGFTLAAFIFLMLRTFTDFTRSVMVVISITPMIIIDGILSFGSYTFHLPFIGDKTITHFVMTCSFIDWIFGFQLFNPAKDIIANYDLTEPISSILIQFITFIFSVGDSIIQIIIFSLTIYYIISLIEYQANRDFSWQIPVSILLGAVPVIIYAVFFSNPVEEFKKSNIHISSVFNFFNTAPLNEIIYVALLAFFSFILVFFIISIITRSLLSTAITFVPKMQEQIWRTSYVSVAFLITLLYTFLYIMHPDYKWYIIILVIILWKAFRGVMGDISREAKMKTIERQTRRSEVMDIVTELKKTDEHLPTHDKPKSEKSFNIEVILIISAIVVLLIGILIIKGILWT